MTLRGTLTLDGDGLTVRTNSEERRDLMLAELHELTGGNEIVAASSEPLSMGRGSGTARDRSSDGGSVGAFGQPLSLATNALEDDLAVRAAVAEHLRGYEERWLDLDIPSLDGCAQRQAAADPARRDLIRLLASFPEASDDTQGSAAAPHAARSHLARDARMTQ